MGVRQGARQQIRLQSRCHALKCESMLDLGHIITGQVTPCDLSYYHRPCDTPQHVSEPLAVRAVPVAGGAGKIGSILHASC